MKTRPLETTGKVKPPPPPPSKRNMCVSCRTGTRPTSPPCSSAIGFLFARLWQETRAAGRLCENLPYLSHQGSRTIDILTHFQCKVPSIGQQLCVPSVHVCPCCRAGFQSPWVLFDPPPASLSSSVSCFRLSLLHLIAQSNNYSPCSGTSVPK